MALQAARTEPIRRLVTYDAAVSLSGSLERRWRPELEHSMAAGQLDHAWAHLVQGLETAGPVSKLPLGALRMLSILSARTRLGAEMRQLLPTAVAEMRAVLKADAELADFAGVTTPTLMLSGGWSPAYFAETGRQLAAAVPAIDFALVPGQLHEGPLRPGHRLALTTARFLANDVGLRLRRIRAARHPLGSRFRIGPVKEAFKDKGSVEQQFITTHDGGRLALYSYGTVDAPGERRVVVIGGAFLTALIYRPFSEALSKGLGEGWAVDVYDRRGRGDSTPQPADYSMATEIADVRASHGRHRRAESLRPQPGRFRGAECGPGVRRDRAPAGQARCL